MKRSVSFAALAAFALVAPGVAVAQPDITAGTWMRADGAAQVRVQKCGEALCAINVWVKNPGDEAVGDRLVMNVKPVKPGQLEGSAFDPKRNLRFASKITFNDRAMTTSGCMLGGLLCKSVQWSKVASR